MKNSAILLVFISILFCSQVSFSQELDFDKYADRLVKAADHENDSRVHYYDVGFYFLDLEMDDASVYLTGSARIDLDLEVEYSNELVFELQSNMIVDSVKVNGSLEAYTHTDNNLVIDYEHGVDFNENYQVSAVIYYRGTPTDGMFHSSDIFESQLFEFTYSLTEPYYSKYWFPCKQILTDKADSCYFYLTIPEDLKAGSNGLLANEYNIGGGKKRMEWQSSYPIVYYLISVAVADYMDYSFTADIPNFSESVLVQNYIPNNTDYFDNNDWYINRTEEMMVAISDVWGIYPFVDEKYGHCIVPLGGGMEHQTMTTLGTFDFRLVVHELAHSWFGDYVTCATWQDIWINEGFASYGEYLGEYYIQSEGFALTWLQGCQSLAKEAPTGSVYVPFDELNDVGRVFNYRLSYRKGACLVHMIRYMIDDDDLFFATLREFLDIYGHSTATAEDLKVVLETETGIEFDDFFTEWYYGEGFPTYSAEWYQTGSNLHIEMNQTTSAPATTLFTIPMEFEITYSDMSTETIRKDVDANFCSYDIPVVQTVTNVVLNPTYSILADFSSIQNTHIIVSPNAFKLYPNPSTDRNVHIYTDIEGEFLLTLTNIAGQEVFNGVFESRDITPDFSNLKQGIYFIKLTDGKSTYTEKLILN